MIKPGFTAFVEHAPGRSVSNTEMPIFFEDIAPRTGIQFRNVAEPTETIESLSLAVGRRIFDHLNIKGRDCAGLVLASFLDTSAGLRDRARMIADELGISGPVHGINFACSGFPAAVQIALSQFAQSTRHVLVLTVEMLSRFTDWKDQGTAILFGDRAAATTIHPDGRHKILRSWAEKIKDEKKCICVETIADAVDAWGKVGSRDCIVMSGRPLYRMAPQRMLDLSLESLPGLGLQPKDLSLICQHQANGKFAEKLRNLLISQQLLHIEVANEIGHMGNVAASSIPCALLKIEDRLKNDRIVACPSVGAGPDYETGTLSQGVVVFRSTNG